MANRVAGIIQFRIGGEFYNAKGSFTYGYGYETRTTIIGSDRVHGFSSAPVAPFIEGAITDDGDVDIKKLASETDIMVVLELGNGKTVSLTHSWMVNADGLTGSTEESEIPVRFEGRNLIESKG